MRALKHLVIHVLKCGLSFWDLEELSELLVRLCIRIKVHLGVLLQLLIRLVLFLSPCELPFRQLLIDLLKEGWPAWVYFLLVGPLLALKLLLSLFPFRLLLVEYVKKVEVSLVPHPSLVCHFLLLPLLTHKFFSADRRFLNSRLNFNRLLATVILRALLLLLRWRRLSWLLAIFVQVYHRVWLRSTKGTILLLSLRLCLLLYHS